MRFFIRPDEKRHQGSGTNCCRLCSIDIHHLFGECPNLLDTAKEMLQPNALTLEGKELFM